MFAMLNKIESIVKGTGYIELKGYNAGYKQDRMSVLVSKGEQSSTDLPRSLSGRKVVGGCVLAGWCEWILIVDPAVLYMGNRFTSASGSFHKCLRDMTSLCSVISLTLVYRGPAVSSPRSWVLAGSEW